MFDTVGRAIRRIGSAVLIAAAPLAALSVTQAAAQFTGMPTETYPLTPQLVASWAQSYPEVVALTEQLGAQYNVPAGDDPMTAIAGLGMVTAAMGQLNAAVAGHGFTDYAQWANVTMAVVFAYAVVAAPADQQGMLAAMFQVPQGNVDAVAAHRAAVEAVIDQ